MADFILVQHAEKAPAAEHPSDPGLSETGRRQARLTAERLQAIGIGRLLTSPLRRAAETAQPIATELHLPAETDPRLRERMNWGDAPHQQTLAEFLADWTRSTVDRDFVPPSGDSSGAAGARLLALLDELAAPHPPHPIALVTHGGVTTDLLRTLFGDDHIHSVNPHLIPQGVPACALTHLTRRDSDYDLLDLASVTHLPIPLRTGWRPS